MEDLVEQIVAATGVEAPVARRATGIILNFLAHEAPAGAVDALLDGLPGARDLAADVGGGSGGLVGVFGELTGAGLDLAEIQGVAGVLLDYARSKAGTAVVDAVVEGVPGLSQFV